MSKVTLFSFVLVLSVLYLPMATPVAAQDVKTCSGNLAFCKKGVARRYVRFLEPTAAVVGPREAVPGIWLTIAEPVNQVVRPAYAKLDEVARMGRAEPQCIEGGPWVNIN